MGLQVLRPKATKSGYDELFKKDKIIKMACFAHARRKFDEAASSRPKEAREVLPLLSQIEKATRQDKL